MDCRAGAWRDRMPMTEPTEKGLGQPGLPGQNLPQPLLPLGAPGALQRYQAPRFEEPDADALSLEQYIQVLLRRKWLLLSVTLTVVFLAMLQVFTVTPIYRATSTLQIDPEGEKVLPYQQVESSSVGGRWDLEQYIFTQAEILQSGALARRVVEKLDLAEEAAFNDPGRSGVVVSLIALPRRLVSNLITPSPDRSQDEDRELKEEALSAQLLGGITVKPLRNTRLIEVSFESRDAKLAARVANTLAEEFIEQHLEGKFDATTRATVFLERQLEDLQIKVEQSEQALLRYAQEQNIVNLGERETIARKRLADLSDELTRAETAFLSEQARYAATQAATLESFPEILKTEAMRELEQRLSALRGELSGLSNVYGPEWPRMKTLRSEIAGLEAQLADRKRQALSSARQEAALVGNRQAKLEAAVAEQRALVDRLNEASIQYNILEREAESNKELYEGLLQRLKEAGVSAGLRSSNIRVADRASEPRSPASPNKARSLALAIVVGLFFGTGLVFLAEALDNTLKSPEDVTEKLGLPGLGVVPQLELAGTGRSWRTPGTSRRVPSLPILAFGDEGAKGLSRAIEAYRSLRTSLLLSHSGTPPKIFLVTSALPGEGKSTTAANIAIALAQTGARTLLVDLDMRKPVIASVLGVSAEKGMSTYLSGNSDLSSLIQRTSFTELFVVPAGPMAPNPAELIGSKRMRTGLELVREYFTHVVIDSPPALEISDAMIVSPAVDGVIVVARAGKTPRKAVGRAAGQIMSVGGKLLGVLLNGANLDQPGYGYYSGAYGSYYGRYFEDRSKKTA